MHLCKRLGWKYNEYGKEVARYEYDAYGNHEVLN